MASQKLKKVVNNKSTEQQQISLKGSTKVEGVMKANPTHKHYLTKLELRNFKCFKEQSIDIKRGLTIIAGANNSGKTSIFQALSLWESCKNLLYREKPKIFFKKKGKETTQDHGVPLLKDDLPFVIPIAKNLWYNNEVKQAATETEKAKSYTLSVKCSWNGSEEGSTEESKKDLEISLYCDNDEIVNVRGYSNIEKSDAEHDIRGYSPTVVYLPYLSNVLAKELYYLAPNFRALIAEGKTGEVVRNIVYRLKKEQEKKLEELRKDQEKKLRKEKEEIEKKLEELKNWRGHRKRRS